MKCYTSRTIVKSAKKILQIGTLRRLFYLFTLIYIQFDIRLIGLITAVSSTLKRKYRKLAFQTTFFGFRTHQAVHLIRKNLLNLIF
jgi:hypothetical protein